MIYLAAGPTKKCFGSIRKRKQRCTIPPKDLDHSKRQKRQPRNQTKYNLPIENQKRNRAKLCSACAFNRTEN